MRHLRFYFEHSLHDLTRNRLRTAFALFCVAAGVAAIVALRTLGLAIGDTLVTNIAGTLHGDMMITVARGDSQYVTTGSDGRRVFTDAAVSAVQKWVTAHNGQVTGTIEDSSLQVAAQNGSGAGRPSFINTSIIDPAQYPYYGGSVALDPPGVPLRQLFTGGNDVVVSDNLAKTDNLKIGDQVHVSHTDKLFTVRGIISAQNGGFSLVTLFFGFAYFDSNAISTLQADPRPDTLYIKLPYGADTDQLQVDILRTVGSVGRIDTTAAALRKNQQLATIIDRLIVTLGLIALLIGGMGIIHTMLVVVRRRMVEIAVLKTIGMQGRQIALLFLIESILMGILGSILGDFLGELLSGAVLGFAQRIWVQTLQWRIYPQALLTGFLFGVLVTAIFGIIPTLTAAQVRPAAVLRPNESLPPAAGCLQTLLALLVIVVGVGLLVGDLINNFLLGLVGVGLVLLLLGVLVGLMYILVAVISILPAFNLVDLRLALRGLGGQRFRAASTLLALTVGVFALSSVTLAAFSVPALLNIGFQNVLGGNVLVATPLPILLDGASLMLNQLPGVDHYMQIGLYTGRLEAINGDTQWYTKINSGIPALSFAQPNGRSTTIDSNAMIKVSEGTISGLNVTAKGFQGGAAIAGRALSAEDSGQLHIVLRQTDTISQLGIKPGDKLTYRFGSSSVTFTLVGILQSTDTGAGIDLGAVLGAGSVPVNAFPAGISPTLQFIVAQVTPAELNNVLVALSALPGVFTLDVGFIDSLIRKLLDVFTTIPTIVAILSLFAAAVIIANTVSLATLERRRQIGIMKAVGLRGWRVLAIMTLENGILGVLGGLIGVGLSVLGTAIVSAILGVSLIKTVSWGSVLLLMLLSILITLVATALSAWTATREKPLNVLRYE